MDRRGFLKSAGSVGLSYAGAGLFSPLATATRLQAEECSTGGPVNPNWAQKNFEPQAKASSYFIDPPWGYQPANAFDPDEHIGWESNEQLWLFRRLITRICRIGNSRCCMFWMLEIIYSGYSEL